MHKIISGRYQDRLLNPQGTLLRQRAWCRNLILHNCNRLLAALMKGEAGMAGLLYWAVGAGEPGWDALMPNPQPTNVQLTQEIARFPLTAGQIDYIDDEGNPSPTPTQRLAVRLDIEGSALVKTGFQCLREFGLFGGDATTAANSGLMINQAIHPRIDISPGMTLSRTLHLNFTLFDDTASDNASSPESPATPPVPTSDSPGSTESPAPTPVPTSDNLIFTGPRAALPVSAIDGVGRGYANALARAGVSDLAAMAQLDPIHEIGKIPESKLREFRAKARLVLRYPTDLGDLSPLAPLSVAEFLQSTAATLLADGLASGVTRSGVTLSTIEHWQARLESVQIALDEDQLAQIALGDLIAA